MEVFFMYIDTHLHLSYNEGVNPKEFIENAKSDLKRLTFCVVFDRIDKKGRNDLQKKSGG